MIEPTPGITAVTLGRWLSLGLPATVLWSIGGFGAFSLMLGLSNGSVTPGTDSTAAGLSLMWGAVIVCAGVGILLGTSSLFLRIKRSILTMNVIAGFCSLFFSVLTAG